jgi:hypothetical protein
MAMATELRDKLDELINEYGDGEVYVRDQLEPKWRVKARDVQRESGQESFLVVLDD